MLGFGIRQTKPPQPRARRIFFWRTHPATCVCPLHLLPAAESIHDPPPALPPTLTLASQSTVCCTLLKCNTPPCSGLTLRVFYVPPASGGTGCQQLAQPLPAMGPLSPLVRARSFGCTASSGTHDATVLNPFGAAVSIYATDGADCGRSPATSSLFKSYGPTWDRAGTRATTLSFTGAPCQETPCCTLVDWSRPSPKLRTPPEKRRRKAPP